MVMEIALSLCENWGFDIWLHWNLVDLQYADTDFLLNKNPNMLLAFLDNLSDIV